MKLRPAVLPHFILWSLGLAKAWTFYGEAECRSLEKYAAGKKRLVEIGCWQGVNTSRLRKVMSENAVLYAVDPYPTGRLGFSAPQIIAHREVEKVQRGRVQWIRLTDLEAARFIRDVKKEPLDFIFSDSLNTYEGLKAAWEAWSPLLQKGGIYILANTQSTPERNIDDAGSVIFTREVILKSSGFQLLETCGSFTILKKVSDV